MPKPCPSATFLASASPSPLAKLDLEQRARKLVDAIHVSMSCKYVSMSSLSQCKEEKNGKWKI